MKIKKNLGILLNGIIKENPVLVLVLGTCPTLAVTTMAVNGLGMGAAATVVLICSNAVISLLKNLIPDKVRIPAYITIIAGFVTVVQFFVQAYAPSINQALGIFLPLIVVNCIILARAEVFANKNSVGTWHGNRLYPGTVRHGLYSGNPWKRHLDGNSSDRRDYRADDDFYPGAGRIFCLWHPDCAGQQNPGPQRGETPNFRLRRLPIPRVL